MEIDYVTQRKTKKMDSLNNSSSSMFNTTVMSLPENTMNENENYIQQIYELKIELASAHQEVDNLLEENQQLKSELEHNKTVIENYKKIRFTPTPSSERLSSKNKRQKRKSEQKLSSATKQIRTSSPTNSATEKKFGLEKNNTKPRRSITKTEITKNKICLISTNNKNRILSIAEATIKGNFELCHYISPHAGNKQLFTGINEKLSTFTKQDYCIILIAEEDFQMTKNYFDQIIFIRETLRNITHTNVIICLPTYKCKDYVNMHNWRVENFNNLLYLDIITHEHAYLLDSNKNIYYDYSLYNTKTGIINDKGIRVIFRDLNDYIQDLQEYNNNELQTNLEETNFFLD